MKYTVKIGKGYRNFEITSYWGNHPGVFPNHWDSKTKTKFKNALSKCAERKMDFTITFSDAERIWNSNCTYCGDNENCCMDRIDSSMGYFKENVQPLCYKCNMMKMTMSPDVFINQIKKISEFYLKS